MIWILCTQRLLEKKKVQNCVLLCFYCTTRKQFYSNFTFMFIHSRSRYQSLCKNIRRANNLGKAWKVENGHKWVAHCLVWPWFRYFTIRSYTQVIWNAWSFWYLQLDRAEQIHNHLRMFFVIQRQIISLKPSLRLDLEQELQMLQGWWWDTVWTDHTYCDWWHLWLCMCWWKVPGHSHRSHTMVVLCLSLMTMCGCWQVVKSAVSSEDNIFKAFGSIYVQI